VSTELVPVRRKIVTPVRGPSVWIGLRGWLILEDGDFIVGQFWSKDDAGNGIYLVRMPKSCVTIEDEPVAA
jgi:hypothetical protein